MWLELNLLDQTKSEKDILTEFFKKTNENTKGIFIPSYYASKIKTWFDKINVICPVDYPFGLGSTLLRQHECINAINKGANYIDLVVNPIYLTNGQKDLLINDIKSIKSICDNKNVELRVILEYRMFADGLILTLCALLRQLGIIFIIPSTGQYVEDLTDNIIFCGYISNKNPGIKTIINLGNCTKENLEKIPSTIYGIRAKTFQFGV